MGDCESRRAETGSKEQGHGHRARAYEGYLLFLRTDRAGNFERKEQELLFEDHEPSKLSGTNIAQDVDWGRRSDSPAQTHLKDS